MKILIDECLPRKLKHELPEYDIKTVPEVGWSGTQNGALLRLMAGVYDVFITIDGNLEDQQQLTNQPVAFVVLVAVNNKLETLVQLMPDVRATLEIIQPGQVVRVTGKVAE